MFGLTPLGTVHTLIALVAVIAGLVSLARWGRIVGDNATGRVYLWTTVVTCLTGFGIFQRGGFGAPHVLGALTLAVLAFAAWPAAKRWFGARWEAIATVCYSLTLFFHAIPGVTETFTRVPVGRPLFTGPEDPALQTLGGVMFVVFLAGAAYQVMRLRRTRARGAVATVLPGAR